MILASNEWLKQWRCAYFVLVDASRQNAVTHIKGYNCLKGNKLYGHDKNKSKEKGSGGGAVNALLVDEKSIAEYHLTKHGHKRYAP